MDRYFCYSPIFYTKFCTLFAFFALLKTIKLQTVELRYSSQALENSNEELRLTRAETHLSREALQEQSKSIKLQNFENTFFKMIDLHNEIVKSLAHSGTSYSLSERNNINFTKTGHGIFLEKVLDSLLLCLQYSLYQSYTGSTTNNNSPKKLSHTYQEERTNINYLNSFKEHEQALSKYFRNLYQILKFISYHPIDNQKFYSNILRAQLSTNELELLFYHCASDLGNEKFLPLLVEFEFLEHLICDEYINRNDVNFYIEKTRKLKEDYKDYKVFGKNEKWKKLVEELIKKD